MFQPTRERPPKHGTLLPKCTTNPQNMECHPKIAWEMMQRTLLNRMLPHQSIERCVVRVSKSKHPIIEA